MNMQTNSSGGFDGENFGVARIKHNVLGRSYVGGILSRRSGLPISKTRRSVPTSNSSSE